MSARGDSDAVLQRGATKGPRRGSRRQRHTALVASLRPVGLLGCFHHPLHPLNPYRRQKGRGIRSLGESGDSMPLLAISCCGAAAGCRRGGRDDPCCTACHHASRVSCRAECPPPRSWRMSCPRGAVQLEDCGSGLWSCVNRSERQSLSGATPHARRKEMGWTRGGWGAYRGKG